MSNTIQVEASKPQKKMQECNKCKYAGFPNELISFEKAGEDSNSGKIMWRLLDSNGKIHIHKNSSSDNSNANSIYKRRKLVDINTVTDVEEARRLIKEGWEYKTLFPATLENIPHYVLVKRE